MNPSTTIAPSAADFRAEADLLGPAGIAAEYRAWIAPALKVSTSAHDVVRLYVKGLQPLDISNQLQVPAKSCRKVLATLAFAA